MRYLAITRHRVVPIEKIIILRPSSIATGAIQLALAPEGKRHVVEAIYRRLNQVVPWARKRIAVKTVIEYQARALSWIFLGRRSIYLPFPYAALLDRHE